MNKNCFKNIKSGDKIIYRSPLDFKDRTFLVRSVGSEAIEVSEGPFHFYCLNYDSLPYIKKIIKKSK